MNLTNKINMFGIMMLTALVTVSTTSASWATSYYVATTGSDSNAGTSSAPFKTIQKCLNVVRPGDQCNINTGTYNEALSLVTSGSSTAPITVQSSGGLVTINSGTSAAVKCSRSPMGYYTFNNLTFTTTHSGTFDGDLYPTVDLGTSTAWWGYGSPADNTPAVDDDTNGNNGFKLFQCVINGRVGLLGHLNSITYCTFNGGGAYTNGIHDLTIVSHKNDYSHNTFTGYTHRAIWSMSNTYGITANYNTITHWGVAGDPAAIDFDGAYIADNNNTANYNLMHDSDNSTGYAVQFENGMNCVMNGNVVYNVPRGMSMINYPQSPGITDYRYTNTNNIISNNVIYNSSTAAIEAINSPGNLIYNNTIDNEMAGGWGAITMADGGSGGVPSNNNVIKNNIITNSNTGITLQGSPTGTVITNNLFYNNSSNGSVGTASQIGNPLYVGSGSDPYNIQTGSAAIDKGTTIAQVPTDKLGTPRPQGSAYDIGAYEFKMSSTALQISPPTDLTVQ